MESAGTGRDEEGEKKSIHQEHLRHASYSNSISAMTLAKTTSANFSGSNVSISVCRARHQGTRTKTLLLFMVGVYICTIATAQIQRSKVGRAHGRCIQTALFLPLGPMELVENTTFCFKSRGHHPPPTPHPPTTTINEGPEAF